MLLTPIPVMIFEDTSLIAFKNSVEFWAAITSRTDLNIVAVMILTPNWWSPYIWVALRASSSIKIIEIITAEIGSSAVVYRLVIKLYDVVLNSFMLVDNWVSSMGNFVICRSIERIIDFMVFHAPFSGHNARS